MKPWLFRIAWLWAGVAQAFQPATLTEVGLGLGGNPYWSHPVFANNLWNGTGWIEFATNQWGSTVYFENNPQFDANGYPKYLNPGLRLRAIVYSLHANDARPASWPDRTTLARGKVVLTWQGDADIRANGGSYLAGESNGASTGRIVNGRRVYRFTGNSRLEWITIEAINPANPITDIKLWLPDPADPDNATLEGQRFHPTYLARLADAPWAFLRFMDWNDTNASPQRDWADRRRPAHVFQQGVLNRRAPANGFAGDRQTGCAYEHMVALCNATGRDMWITIPHLATDDYITKLAQLLRYGSDGVEPYTNTVANPVHPPLAPERRVFVEYSNEIWSNGDSFPQGNWAQDQANAAGLSKERFNARRFCEVWRIFQTVFANQTNRIIRVAAVWTGLHSYTSAFLNEIAAYGPTLTPPQTADIIAPTTYFGNGIQDWAHARAQEQAGTSDPWFYTTETFTNGGIIRPVSVPVTNAYWTGTNVTRHLAETFAEWKRRQLSGSTQTGGGPDATGLGGGFDLWLRTTITNAFGTLKPIVSYEGGPSIYTDYLDGPDSRDDGITIFMELLNRQPAFAQIYRNHLHLAKAKGLRTHGAFVDIGRWGKYGQWGHLEHLAEHPTNSVKWSFLLAWPTELTGLRHVDEPLGTVPAFLTPAKLPVAFYGQPYSQTILHTNATQLTVIDRLLTSGLAFTNHQITGTPTAPGENYLFLQLRDADGDPAWRTFHWRTVGGPGVILECDFEGTNPAQNLPWTARYVLKPGVTFSGWTRGSGIIPAAGNDALVWSQNMPANETDSTLALAQADNEHWRFTLTPAQFLDLRDAEARFTLRRIDYHAPRRYALFVNGTQVFDTGRFTDVTDREFVCRLTGIHTNAVEFRLVGYAGQYGGHKTTLRAFKLTGTHETGYNAWVAGFPTLLGADALPEADPDRDGLSNLLEYALNLPPHIAGTNGLPVHGRSGDHLTLTYTRRQPPTDVRYIVEAASDPAGPWSADGVTEEILGSDGALQTVRAFDPATISAHRQRFLRLRVER